VKMLCTHSIFHVYYKNKCKNKLLHYYIDKPYIKNITVGVGSATLWVLLHRHPATFTKFIHFTHFLIIKLIVMFYSITVATIFAKISRLFSHYKKTIIIQK